MPSFLTTAITVTCLGHLLCSVCNPQTSPANISEVQLAAQDHIVLKRQDRFTPCLSSSPSLRSCLERVLHPEPWALTSPSRARATQGRRSQGAQTVQWALPGVPSAVQDGEQRGSLHSKDPTKYRRGWRCPVPVGVGISPGDQRGRRKPQRLPGWAERMYR